jgi:hypothetical protein
LGDRVSSSKAVPAYGITNWNTAGVVEAAEMRHFDFAFGFMVENFRVDILEVWLWKDRRGKFQWNL